MSADAPTREELERRLAELEASSEAQFRTITESSADAIFITDREGNYTYVNRAACDLLGYSADELTRMNIMDLTLMDRAEFHLEQFQKILAEGRGIFESEILAKDGTPVPVDLNAVVMPDGRVYGSCRDISERRRAEAARREAEQTARVLLDAPSEIMLLLDDAGGIVALNEAAANLFGGHQRELTGRCIWDLLSEEVLPERRQRVAAVLRTSKPQRWEDEDGERRYENAAYPIPAPDRHVDRVAVYAVDITERRRAEEETRRLGATVEEATVGVAISDLQGNLTYVNQTLCDTYGYSADELIGRPAFTLNADAAAPVAVEPDMMEAGRWSGEVLQRRKDGSTFPGLLSIFMIRGPGDAPESVVAFVNDISEQKASETALRENEERFRQLAANINEVLYVYAPAERRFLYVSPAYEQIWEQPMQRLLDDARAFTRSIHPDDRAAFFEAARLEQAEGQPFDQEYRIVMPDDRIKWVRSRNVLLRDARGRHHRTVGVAEDITVRKLATERLGKTEQLLTETGRMARVGGWQVDVAARRVTWSQVTREIHEVDDDFDPEYTQAVGFFEPEDRPVLEAALEAAMGDGTPYDLELRFTTAKGRHLWTQTKCTPVVQGGEVVELRGTFQDITERRQAEEALRQSEERLRALFRSATDTLILLDQAHRVQTINRVGPDIEQQDLLGNCILDVLPEELVAEAGAALDRVVSGAAEERMEVPYRRSDGSVVHYDVVLAPVVVEDEVIGSLVSARDVTDQVHLEERKDQLERQFLQSQKMEAVGSLAGGIAHDFNNLLTVINSYAGFAVADLQKNDPLRDDIQQILDAGRRAASLTRQLLAFSRRQVMEPRVLDLNQVIGDMEKMLRRLIGEHIDLQIDPAEGLGRVSADPAQLEQVLMNLVVNARDAMETGGELRIETADVSLDAAYADHHPDARAGDHVKVVVSDTGEGMDEAVRERIFEPFFTTKEKGQGTGLGLATVYGIVRQSGGHVTVESEPGQGTAFSVYLPRVEADEADLEPRPEPEATSGTETILVVEDDRGVRDLARRILQTAGYQVLTAANGGEALLTCERHEGAIHLMLTDVVMPQMSGRELADRLARLAPGMRVVFMSGYTDDAIVKHGVLDAGTRFIGKPFTAPNLLRQVRICLDAD